MPHRGNPVYFKETSPFDWGVTGYVKFQIARGERTPRQIQDSWPRSLRSISNCKDDCCSQDEIDQANVQYGRWKNTKTADREYLTQWLAEQGAKKKSKGGRPSFHIGSVGSIFTGTVDTVDTTLAPQSLREGSNGVDPDFNQVYNSAENVSRGNVTNAEAENFSSDNVTNEGQAKNLSEGKTTSEKQAENPPSANIISEGQAEDVVAANSSNDDFNFQQLLHNFKTIYKQMTHKTLLSFGRYLETEIYNCVMEEVAAGFKEMNQVFLWVIDLSDPIMELWFGVEMLKEIQNRVLPLPKVHPSVITSISRFTPFTTADQYRDHAESTAYRPAGELYNKEKHFGAAWVHSAMRHLVSLIHDSGNLLLSEELLEGSLECVLWANLVDLLIVDVFVARRRDASLQAFRCRPDILQGNDPHFDAVICNHTRTRPSSTGCRIPDEWGLIEVSRKNDGPDSPKWKKDNLKMLRGLCAMMRLVRDYVDHDEAALKNLQFPGLIQAGLEVMTVRLTCVGHLFVKEVGTLRKVPTTTEDLHEAFELLESLWLFKQMMVDCQRVVQSYIDSKEKGLKRPAPTSPGTYCREKLHKSGTL